MKKLFTAIMMVMTLMFLSCCKKETAEVESGRAEESMSFEKEQYDIKTRSVGDCTVNGCESAEFTVINTKIADIVSSKENECRIEGKKEGATVIKAASGQNECRAVINVIREDSSRKAVEDNEWYIVIFAYEDECKNVVETFFTQGKPVIEEDTEKIMIKKSSGKYIYCVKEKFLYFEYEIYRG